MATLNEAPAQLNAWIEEINGQIGKLSDRRQKFVDLLASLGEPAAAAPVPAPKPPSTPRPQTDAAARRAADAERKRQSRAKSQPRTGGSKYDYVEVARVANAAVRAGVSPTQAVRRHFNVTDAMGTYLIKTARKQGHDIEGRQASAPPKPAAPSNVTPITPGRAFTPDDTRKIIDGG